MRLLTIYEQTIYPIGRMCDQLLQLFFNCLEMGLIQSKCSHTYYMLNEHVIISGWSPKEWLLLLLFCHTQSCSGLTPGCLIRDDSWQAKEQYGCQELNSGQSMQGKCDYSLSIFRISSLCPQRIVFGSLFVFFDFPSCE